jgi:hypothetical protein
LDRPAQALYDPRNGDLSLRVTDLDLAPGVAEPERTNYFSVYWVADGAGTFWADAARHPFGPNTLLFFVPYQYVRLTPDGRPNWPPPDPAARAAPTNHGRPAMQPEHSEFAVVGGARRGRRWPHRWRPRGGGRSIQVAMRAGLPSTALRDMIFSDPTMAEGLNDLFDALE